MLLQRRDVEPGRVVDAAGDVGDGDHRRPALVELGRGDPADVAEALDDAAKPRELPAETAAGTLDHHHDPGSRRLVPEDGAADRDRLAGHDLGHDVADLRRVGVHHPGHRLLVRRHVRRRDVLLRADERGEVGGEAPGQPRELRLRERARVAAHAALRAAVGQSEERALPGHPHRERRTLAEVDAGVVADAALRRPEHRRVLHAVGRERPYRPVVHPHRQGQDHCPLGQAQALRDVLRDARVRRRLLELRAGLPVERRVPLEPGRGRRNLDHGADSTPGRPQTAGCAPQTRGRSGRMPGEGLEPPRPEGHSVLSRARLPVPPPRRGEAQAIDRARASVPKNAATAPGSSTSGQRGSAARKARP